MKTILEALEYYSRHSADKTCLIDGVTNEKIEYGVFWENILRCASKLRQRGLKSGGFYILHTKQTISHLVTFYAIQVAGGVAIPVERAAPEEKLREFSVQFGADIIQSDMSYGDCEPIEFTAPNEMETAVVILTTGTTGKSKGVLSSYKCRFCGADNVRYSYEITPDDVALVPQVLSHSGGLRRVEAMLVSGATVVIMGAAMFFGNIFGAVQKYGVTILQFVPAQIAQILQSAEKRLRGISEQIRILSVGSAVIPESHKERLRELLPGVRLFNDFGSTEAIGSSYFEWSAYPPKADCIGIESLHSKIVFLNDNYEIMEQTSRNNPGTIATEGGTLMSGYHNEPLLTAEVLKNGRFISNDLGFRGEDGLVYILGRKDDIIVSGANKISPYEIEDSVSLMEGIIECAVVSKPSEIMGAVPILFYVGEREPVEIYDYLSNKLEKFKIPMINDIIKVNSLPRSDGTGKVLRKELISKL